MKTIIGFTGKMGSGKTTACDYITEHYPHAVKIGMKNALVKEMKDNFPDLLSAIVEQEFFNADMRDDGTKYDINIDWLFKNKPPIMRALMQNYGTEVRRRDDPAYWTKRWRESVEAAEKDGVEIVVIDDVRFHNEAAAVREAGGIIVRIARPDIHTTGGHISESEMDTIEVDRIISAEPGDFDSLYKELDDLVS